MDTHAAPLAAPHPRRADAPRSGGRLPGAAAAAEEATPGLGAAGAILTEAGAGGVQLLREEAVVAEALQGVPGGDDRHHH